MNRTTNGLRITTIIVVTLCVVLFLMTGCTPHKSEEECVAMLEGRGYNEYILLEGKSLKQACIDFKVEEGRVIFILKSTKGTYPDLNVCYVFCLNSKSKANSLNEQLIKLGFYTELDGFVVLADTYNQ